jgi:hypothetical protein
MRPNLENQEDFTWQPYRVKPMAVWAMRMNQDFECVGLQGTLRGRAGDWMVRGNDGTTFPVAHEVFQRCYVSREWRKHESQEKDSSETQQVGGPQNEVHEAHVR